MFYLHMEHEKEGDKLEKSVGIEWKLFLGVLEGTRLEGFKDILDFFDLAN